MVAAIDPNDLTIEIVEAAIRGEVPDVAQHPGWADPEGAEEYFRSLRDGETE